MRIKEIHAQVLRALADGCYVGLRVDDVSYGLGDRLPPSRQWWDDEPCVSPSGEPIYLSGTSAILIADPCSDDEDEARSLDRAIAKIASYSGDHVYLVASQQAEYGEDDGEIVLEDAIVLCQIDDVLQTVVTIEDWDQPIPRAK